MHISKALFVFTLYVISLQVLAAPVSPHDGTREELDPFDIDGEDEVTADDLDEASQVEARDDAPGSSKSNPIKGTTKVSEMNRLAFDTDCYAILCLGVEPIFQRDGTESINNRKNADARKSFGGGHGPFRDPKTAKAERPGKEYVSPEEFPFASTKQGGTGAILYPVFLASQRSQSGAINHFYHEKRIDSGHSKGKKSWFQITGWDGPRGPYCKAFNSNKGQPKKDDPICKKETKAEGPWALTWLNMPTSMMVKTTKRLVKTNKELGCWSLKSKKDIRRGSWCLPK